MSRRLFTTITSFRLLTATNHKTSITLSRFLSNGVQNESLVTPVAFNDGFLKFRVDNQNYVLSFWTPVNQVADVLRPVTSSPKQAAAPGQEVDLNVLAVKPVTVKVLDMNQEEVVPTTEPAALGTVLSDSGSIVVSASPDDLTRPIQLKLDGIVDDLKKWMLEHSPPKPFEAQVLQKERESIVATYSPMEEQFMALLTTSETQAQKRFKYGGLFLLSAQLGFVARLTWFEYSWDIMEPITWCLTYTMMLGTFSYYVLTTQEFMLPMVERRAIQERFWKNVKHSNFDVNQFKQLRSQLLSIDRKAKKAKSTPFSSSIPLG